MSMNEVQNLEQQLATCRELLDAKRQRIVELEQQVLLLQQQFDAANHLIRVQRSVSNDAGMREGCTVHIPGVGEL